MATPISQNLYLYVEGDPVNHIDPSGHAPLSIGQDGESVRQPPNQKLNSKKKQQTRPLSIEEMKPYGKAPAPAASGTAASNAEAYTNVGPSAAEAKQMVIQDILNRVGGAGKGTYLNDRLQMTINNATVYNRQFCSSAYKNVSKPIGKVEGLLPDAKYGNYAHNIKLNQLGPGQYIHGQDSMRDFKMGLSNSASSGCGWVATYNALQVMGIYEKPADIIRWYEMNGGLINDGLGGIWAATVGKYLRDHGYTVNQTWFMPLQVIEDQVKNYDAVILNFMWRSGGHFVTVKKASQGGIWIINEYNSSKSMTGYPSISEFCTGRDWIAVTSIAVRR